MADHEARAGDLDLFISYSPADEPWAVWIAWQLEAAGYSTMIQAWDFVPSTQFIEFMDQGLRRAKAVVAVLSEDYQRSRYGRYEWQTAFRANPDDPSSRLITVRIDESPLEGLLSTITYVDLVGLNDPDEARARLLTRIRHALDGRAKPGIAPAFPNGDVLTLAPSLPELAAPDLRGRWAPDRAPAYPPLVTDPDAPGAAVTVLHVNGPRFGRETAVGGARRTADEVLSLVGSDLDGFRSTGAPRPDLVVVTGDLTAAGGLHEFAEAGRFLSGLRDLLRLNPRRLAVVPGANDVTALACRAYFASCEADELTPKPPYWPKWRHFAGMFEKLYADVDDVTFDAQQPWTLFDLPDLRVVVAGLNSTMAESHLPEDHYGWLDETQIASFAQQLDRSAEAGWLRLGIVGHVLDGDPNDRTATGAPEVLRDGAELDRVLGPRLNLLFHGAPSARPGVEADRIGSTATGLTTMGPSGGRLQLVTVHHGGLIRWAVAGSGAISGPDEGARPGPERFALRWARVGAALPDPTDTDDPSPEVDEEAEAPAASRPGAGGGRPAAAEVGEQESPAEVLLDRIEEVCLARHPHPRLRRGPGTPPNLWVTYVEDGVTRHHRVAAHVGPVDEAVLELFLANVHATDPDVSSELVYSGPPASPALRDEARLRGVQLRSFIEYQGLLDLRGFVADQTGRLERDQAYDPRLHVPQRFRDLAGPDRSVRTGLTDELLRLVGEEDGRFVLVLGDFGRGKTFALREVARRIPSEIPDLRPILIDLRSLDKVHTVEALVAAHLTRHGEDLPLKPFRYMLREGRIVLLFDGFDELASRVTYDRATDHLDALLQAMDGKAKIIVSSRTQHFWTDDQVLTALGERIDLLPQRRVLSISDFTDEQVLEYLVNREAETATSRLGAIKGGQLLGLCHNPRMLSLVAELDPQRLEELAATRDVRSPAQLYEELLGTWMDLEVERTRAMGGPPSSLTKDDLWAAVTTLALRLYESSESYLRLDALADAADALVQATSPGRTRAATAERPMSAAETTHAIGAGTLLIRTNEGLFGFIHESVVDWLVAKDIAAHLSAEGDDAEVEATAASGDVGLLGRTRLSRSTIDFLCDLSDRPLLQAWCKTTLADPDCGAAARRNALGVTRRLELEAKADLHEAQLAGEDLSQRQFAGTDFRGADLTNALLVGTNLRDADLRGAQLVGANLDKAVLAGARLDEANLDRARLFRTDLRGAQIEASTWRRAALVATSHDDTLAEARELRGAAIAPGQPVEVALAPAVVSSSYGFEAGRLPWPAAFTHDGSTVAIGGDDGGVLLCDVSTGKPVRTLRGHRGHVYSVVCGPGHGPLVTGAADATIRLWDQETFALRHVLGGQRGWVWPVVLAPNGDVLAVGDSSGTVRLWDTATGEVIAELPDHAVRVWTVRFRHDSQVVASGDVDGAVRLWDVASGEELTSLVPRGRGEPAVYRVRFDPDGTVLATGHDGGAVRLWDLASGTVRHELAGHESSVYTLDFHPSGGLLATGDTRGGVRLWDAGTGRLEAVLPKHTGALYHVRFSRDGRLLATADSNGDLRLWDPDTGEIHHELPGHKSSVWPVTFSPDDTQVISASRDGSARIWTTDTGQCRHVIRGHGRRVESVRFSADSKLLATSGSDGDVRVWDSASGDLHQRLTVENAQLISAVFSPAGPQLATATSDGRVYLWCAGSDEVEREVNLDTQHIWATAFSPDGDMVATANDEHEVGLWYASTSHRPTVLEGPQTRVRSIEFHRNRPILATGCDDGVVRIWDTAEAVLRTSFSPHDDRVHSVDFNLTDDVLVSASIDGLARMWHIDTGDLLLTIGTPGVPLWSAAFSPDGRMLVTGGDDRTVTLWDPTTGEELHRLSGHTQRIRSITFSPDGRMLASAGDDGTVQLWNVADDEPTRHLTLLGLPGGWTALAPDGRYKFAGDVAGAFWHVIGTRRFEPGDLDPYLPDVRRIPVDAAF